VKTVKLEIKNRNSSKSKPRHSKKAGKRFAKQRRQNKNKKQNTAKQSKRLKRINKLKSRNSAKAGKNGKKGRTKRIILTIVGVIVTTGILAGGFWAYKTYSALEESGVNPNPTQTIVNTITQKEPELAKTEDGFTSALAVGIDTRASNPGLRNTDSIIIITLNHNTNEVTMLSLPRDLWVELPTIPGRYSKINSVYNICESQQEGTGMQCLSDVAQRLTNLEIQYHGMIDIAGFVKVIDTLGGVEVDVDNSFTDYMFPTPQNTYETISFQSGLQTMDGETAMKFARSRHAQSSEGSDFARARRQQKVIIAAKQKLLSTETLLDPKKILELMDDLSGSIKVSEITTEDIRAGLNKLEKVDTGSIYSMVLDPMAGNWTLITEDPSAAYILVPKAGAGNWQEVHKFVQAYIDDPAIFDEQPKVYVYNGGLGYTATNQKVIEMKEEYPYLNIVFAGNAALQTYTDTNIYSFSEETKFATLNELQEYFTQEWTDEIPQGLNNPYREDISIIMGAPSPEPGPDDTANETDTNGAESSVETQ
jgi:LCP family protein required for cell wall assembly